MKEFLSVLQRKMNLNYNHGNRTGTICVFGIVLNPAGGGVAFI